MTRSSCYSAAAKVACYNSYSLLMGMEEAPCAAVGVASGSSDSVVIDWDWVVDWGQ